MRLRSAVIVWLGVIAALVLGNIGSFGDSFGRDMSNAGWVLTPALSVFLLWRNGAQFRRVDAGVFRPAYALLGTAVCWTLGNVIFAWYEIVLDQVAPSPSPADVFYVAALLLAIAGCGGRLWTLATPATALRAALDALLLGTSATWILWWLLLRSADRVSFLWLYPALGMTAVSLALIVMTRIGAGYRPAWLFTAAAFTLVALADSFWAYQASVGTFMGGQVPDVLWAAGYLLLGFATVVSPAELVAYTRPRELSSRWELLLPYPIYLVAVGLAVTGFAALTFWSALPLAVMAVILVSRQVLTQLENHQLALTLEARVVERTLELREREEHFRAIVQGISDVIMVVKGSVIDEVSASVVEMLGYRPDDLVGRDPADFLHPDDLASAVEEHAQVGDRPGIWGVADMRLQRADGTWCPVEARYVNLVDEPAVGGVLMTFRDVTERHALEERLRTQANQDELTGLANRRRLHAVLEETIAAGRSPSLVLLDLDDFKAVNDSAGHQLGDRLLVAVADRLRRCTRPSDLVVRLGGDEFAVIVRDDPDAAIAAGIAQRIIDDLALPLRLEGRDVRCEGSAGVAAARGAGSDAETLVRDADVAMYAAKQRGKGRFEVFTDAMHRLVLERQSVIEHLRVTIDDGRLLLHYQPIVDLHTGRLVGAEALVRLPLSDGTVLGPDHFIGVAEETGLIGALGAWVLRTACAEAAGWQELRPDGPPLSLAVNVATRQLTDGGLALLVGDTLERTGLAPHLLTLEITEGALAEDDAEIEAELVALRRLGVRLSVDDFGAGHSSLGRLRALPVDELKIDRSFVSEMGDGGVVPIVEVILTLATRLGLDVVAEGIETPLQASLLTLLGCGLGQGYLFARPGPATEVPGWAAEGFDVPSASTIQS